MVKYADGLPLYRQEAIYARDGVDLDRSLISQWMGKVGFELQPLRAGEDQAGANGSSPTKTTLPTLAPGSGKTQKAWLWAYAPDDRPFGGIGPPMDAYRFEDSRGGECVERHPRGFAGILQSTAMQPTIARQVSGCQRGSDAGSMFRPRQETVLRASRQREIAPRDPDRHHCGWAMGDR